MNATLTNDQITAGAAVLCPYCGKAEGMHDHAFPHPRSAPSPQIAEVAELPPLPEQPRTMMGRDIGYSANDMHEYAADAIAASRRAELTYTVDGVVMSPLEYIDYLHDKIATPAPASAGQAAPASLPDVAMPAHLREFVQALVNWSITEHEDEDCCQGCSGLAVWNEAREAWDVNHRPECIVPRAEAILAAQPAEGAGQASLDKERQRDSTEAAKSAGEQ
ncbi:hypothetical protein [Massilia brevitalea]|uniref:hypothetical protein n=1 Tax=Massilia brevitalea TaxID=442526 RepID=UPI002739A088|nr:hypothetical protein [Massilia brevitalea]